MPLSFDPTKQTYFDYLNQLTGYNPLPNSSPFPAETSNPVSDPFYQAGLQAGQETIAGQQGSQKPPSAPTGVRAAGDIAGGANLAQQANNWLRPASEVSSGVPYTGPVSTQYSPFPATESSLFPSTAVNSSPVTASPVPTAGPPPAWGAGTFASYGIPAAVATATALGAQNALGSYQKGTEGGVGGGIRSVADSGNDALTALATGGLSIPASLGAGIWGGLQSGKGKDQRARDTVRKEAQSSGWLDNNFQVPLPSGNLDLGKDSGFRYSNSAGEKRPVYDIDWNDPNAPQAVGWIQPLAAVLSKGDAKLTSDFTAQLYNELTKDGGATDLPSIRKKVVELYNQFKLRPSIVAEAVSHMGLDPGTRDAYLAAVDNLKPGRDFQVKPGEKPGSKPAMGSTPGGVPSSVVNQVSRGRTMQGMGTGAMKRAA